ncbi:MAG: glycosyltransferase family 4 protein [Gammaproteobacteria bacterium]|nr:glycosyltransferase family 4 protein [Gammaproteobacteria bacterium]
MVGTDLAGKGGVRAVVQGYIDGGLFDQVDCTYAATHRYGSPWTKVRAAVTGWARVALLLRRLDAPLVHVHLSANASFWRKSVVCLMARLAGRPYLLHVHSGFFPDFYERQSGPLGRWLIRRIYGGAAVVIALSEQWRSWILRICATARVEVLANGVALADLSRVRRPKPAEPTLLFLGDINRSKGVFDLVRAVARASHEFPRLKLVCGGTGSLEELRRLSEELGLGDRLSCPGWLDAEHKRAELAGATIFVLPSYAEALPMALLEAMSWKLPVITTPVGGIPQVIEHEANGLLVEPGDIDGMAAAITRLVREPALREKLGGAARRTIERSYSLDASVERLIRVYRQFGLEPRANRHAGSLGPLAGAANR